MTNMFRRDFSGGWWPSADANNAPKNTYLRGDNLVLDDEGILSLRKGSTIINGTPLADPDIHTLFTAYIKGAAGGARHRMIGAGNHVYDDFVSLGVTFTGSGDIAINEGWGQVFMARSTTKKKWDGRKATNWGIAAPSTPPTVTALDSLTKTYASCDTGESPAFVANEGTITATFPTGADGTANGSIELTPASTGRATITKTFTSDENFMDIAGVVGDDRDLFDLLAWVSEPENLEKVTVMVGLGTGTDPFQDDYYWFDFNFGSVTPSTVNLQDHAVLSQVAQQQYESKTTTTTGTPTRPGNIRPTATEVDDRIQDRKHERRRERHDKATNPGWTHYSCLRGQFSRSGNTSGRNWGTVRAIKVVYKATSGAGGVVRFDTIRMIGGASVGALMGRLKFRWRAVKEYEDFTEMSPLSPPSNEVEFVGQRARLSIPQADITALDGQADQIWFYFFGGILDKWYRCAQSTIKDRDSFRIDEFSKRPDGTINAVDRTRFTCFGFGVPDDGV